MEATTLTHTNRGVTVAIIDAVTGAYAWHAGAYRRIVAINTHSIKFAGVRKHLHYESPFHTLEVAE
jgi:hypothetical protein